MLQKLYSLRYGEKKMSSLGNMVAVHHKSCCASSQTTHPTLSVVRKPYLMRLTRLFGEAIHVDKLMQVGLNRKMLAFEIHIYNSMLTWQVKNLKVIAQMWRLRYLCTSRCDQSKSQYTHILRLVSIFNPFHGSARY